MRNKLILILLTVFVVGSITGITAYNTISVGEPKKDAILTGEATKDPDTYRSYMVSGYVKDKETGKPIPEAKVDVHYNEDGIDYTVIAFTDENGYYLAKHHIFGPTYGRNYEVESFSNHPEYEWTYIIF